MFTSKLFRISVKILIWIFIACLDRYNLSIALLGIEKDMDINGSEVKILALTGFLIGYTFANFWRYFEN
ncbi:hypothetical protein BG74_06030 [Sodalis-like endosymbiont of Proechinophthirus fluctus]|nr:hypothetical protein BG74_06030 [Sodalis-like endosymbiont of Proechinophthirus fluctus]